MDRFLDYGLWLTANELADSWIAEVTAGKLVSSARSIEFVLKAIEPAQATVLLAKVLAAPPPHFRRARTVDRVDRPSRRIAHELQMLFEKAVTGGFNTPATVRR